MSDARELSQDEIDSLIHWGLPTYDDAPTCEHCNTPTRRIIFGGTSTIPIKVIDASNRRTYRGKIQPRALFCLACGKFSRGVA